MKNIFINILWHCHIDLWKGRIYSESLCSIFFGDDCTSLRFSLLIFVYLVLWLIWKLVITQENVERKLKIQNS